VVVTDTLQSADIVATAVTAADTPVPDATSGPSQLARGATARITPRPRIAMFAGLLLLVSSGLLAGRSLRAELPSPPVAATRVAGAPRSLRTTSVTAREAYMRGTQFVAKRDTTHIRQARYEFLRAADANPAFVDAWIGLASAYQALAQFGAMPSTEAFTLADKAAHKALVLEPESGMARFRLGATIAFYHWRWAEGERLMREGIARDSL
jgi:hypothetical protein